MVAYDVQKEVSTLVLCEERSFGRFLGRALEMVGYPPASVWISARDALASFVHKRYDLAIISSAVKAPDALTLIHDIRAGTTRAPRDLVILLLDTEEDFDPATRIHSGMLGINAFLAWPATVAALEHAVADAISHHHLALDAIELMDAQPQQVPTDDDGIPHGCHGEVFSLPAAALVEGMYLEDDITIHGRVLIGAGTILNEAHLRAVESLLPVIEDLEIRVRFRT